MTDSDAPSRGEEPEPPDEPSIVEGARHYLQDPNGLVVNARDQDERAEDELLELDQIELEELGLVLDDPHQPEPE